MDQAASAHRDIYCTTSTFRIIKDPSDELACTRQETDGPWHVQYPNTPTPPPQSPRVRLRPEPNPTSQIHRLVQCMVADEG